MRRFSDRLSRRLWLAAIPAMAAASLLALQSAPPFAPSAEPDRIVTNWTASPHDSFSVTWRTSTAVEKAFAEIAEAADGPDFDKNARRIAEW